MFHINPQFLRPMRKLALLSIGTVPFFRKVLAQGSFSLASDLPILPLMVQTLIVKIVFFPFRRGFTLEIKRSSRVVKLRITGLDLHHLGLMNIDYSPDKQVKDL